MFLVRRIFVENLLSVVLVFFPDGGRGTALVFYLFYKTRVEYVKTEMFQERAP
jgi:hypothetical protein